MGCCHSNNPVVPFAVGPVDKSKGEQETQQLVSNNNKRKISYKDDDDHHQIRTNTAAANEVGEGLINMNSKQQQKQ